jgi:hypothetical protein
MKIENKGIRKEKERKKEKKPPAARPILADPVCHNAMGALVRQQWALAGGLSARALGWCRGHVGPCARQAVARAVVADAVIRPICLPRILRVHAHTQVSPVATPRTPRCQSILEDLGAGIAGRWAQHDSLPSSCALTGSWTRVEAYSVVRSNRRLSLHGDRMNRTPNL